MVDVRKPQICYNQAKTSSVASGVVILRQAFTFFKICKKKKVVFYGPSSIHVKIVDKKHDPRERSHFWTFFDVFLTYFSNRAKSLKKRLKMASVSRIVFFIQKCYMNDWRPIKGNFFLFTNFKKKVKVCLKMTTPMPRY